MEQQPRPELPWVLAVLLRSKQPRGDVVMVVVTWIYACQSILAKACEKKMTALELVAMRSILAGVITACMLGKGQGRLDERFFGSRQLRKLVTARGAVGATAFVAMYAALARIDVGEHTALTFTNPLIIGVLAGPVLNEPLKAVGVLALLFGLAGAICVAQPAVLLRHGPFRAQHTKTPPDVLGVCLALLGAFLIAVTMLLVRKIKGRVPSASLALSFHLFSALIACNAIFLGIQQPIWVLDDIKTPLLVLTIAATSFAGQPLLNYAYQSTPASRAASLNYLQLLWATLLSMLFFRERPSKLQFLGAFFIVFAGLLSALSSSSSRDSSPPPAVSPGPTTNSVFSPGVHRQTFSIDTDDSLLDDTDADGLL